MAFRRHFNGNENDEETEPLYGSATLQEREKKDWNKFRNEPREPSVGSAVETKYLDVTIKVMKIVTYIMTFFVVLCAAVLSKGTTLFMTSQIKKDITRPYCNKNLDKSVQFLVTIPEVERVTWIWYLVFAYSVPELGTFIRSCRKCLFKSWTRPSWLEFFSLLVTEACPAIGSAILIFVVFPELDVIKGAMLTNAVCFVPGAVAFFSRNPKSVNSSLRMVLDIVSLVAQASSFVIWPLVDNRPILYMIPVAVILISVGWWENFVTEDSCIPFIGQIGKIKKKFENKTYFLYIYMSLIKIGLFIATMVVIYWIREDNVSFLFDNFTESFRHHYIKVDEIDPILSSATSPNYDNAIRNGKGTVIKTDFMTPIYVWLINFLATYICYAFGKFSCKVMIQAFSFAFPINLSVPVLLSGLIAMCGQYNKDECSFSDTIPKYLFYVPPPLYFLNDFVSHQYAWIWLVWLLSQAWITIHIWAPNCEKLASTEKLFVRPLYDAFLIDQSLAMNRRRDEVLEFVDTSKDQIRDLDPLEVNKDSITRIYACGTMWHETKDEMLEFLKSIFRLDQDQCANRIVRNYLQLNLPSYYEFETHIFFDDAFVRTHQDDPDPHVNEFVQTLVSTIDEAATKVHGTEVRVRPPKVYPTPYGGRLVWTLPGKTKMIAHLKDKKKIRAKKRWSQVMYMYYLLGYGIMANDEIKVESKQTVAENTYILALDGDIDFQPDALQLLVDYMKKNKGLGAACGRIHPVGSGGMAWYQLFEYAVGHWMQKATEHVIGCVLCSPGCFSLFRSSALMDNAVMRKYTTKSSEAIHYVQFDQGEDRWLCTLLLQQGYRVEYSAASDAYTHCPEGFNEFYNQRRRWMPSTMANIMDLLMDYQHTVKANDNISMLYILYQVVLMIGTVIGPGTIFLMLVGAFVSAFGLDQWASFFWNATPILLFIVVCATCNSDIQLFFAGLISAVYGLIMMAVFVGVMLQISSDGFLAPSSLFFFCMVGEFVISALLHPKEFYCLKYGIIYYVTVPSMYMLLVIYSVFNMNNVSWGTREVTVVPKPDPKTAKAQKPKEEAPKKKENKIMSFLGANPDDNEGAFEFSLNKLFKCMLCTYRADPKEDKQLKAIQESIMGLSKKLDDLERMNHLSERFEPKMSMQPRLSRKPTMIEGSKARNSAQIQEAVFLEEEEDDASLTESASTEEIMENSWFYDGDLIRGEVHYLNKREETFWNDLLDEYLQPIEDDKEKVARELKDLRDKMVFTFLMINMLFVLVIFLLTLEKDTLHLNWPLDPKINFTYVYDKNEVHLYRDYLQLEPIGFVFLIAFASLLVVQFLAMLVHRFGTYSQILTNTNIEFDLFSTSIDNMTQDEIMAKDPLKMVKDLQKLRGINSRDEDDIDEPVQYRKTVNHLIQDKKRSGGIHDNDKAFHTRLNDIREKKNKRDVGDFRRKSVAFIDQRRQSLVRRASRMPPPNPEGLTHVLQDTTVDDTSDS